MSAPLAVGLQQQQGGAEQEGKVAQQVVSNSSSSSTAATSSTSNNLLSSCPDVALLLNFVRFVYTMDFPYETTPAAPMGQQEQQRKNEHNLIIDHLFSSLNYLPTFGFPYNSSCIDPFLQQQSQPAQLSLSPLSSPV